MAEDKTYKKNWVTLYTDASRHEDGLMAWAFWARHDSGRVKTAGICPDDLCNIHNNIEQGEMYAICQGMHKVLKKLDGIEGFYITSDSMGAINVLKGETVETSPKGKARKEETIRLKIAFDKMVKDHGLEVDFRHIKGHTGKTHNTRYWLNDWCDKILKQVMREHRQKLKQ